MKLLITGASGYLGRALLAHAATAHELVPCFRTHPICGGLSLDLRNADELLAAVVRTQPDAIIHAAALNASPDPEELYAVNALGTGTVAKAANAVGARLVVVSSDTVHGGSAGPYADDAQPTPINPYGASKAAGERAALQAHPNTAVVRTSLLYDTEAADRGTTGFAQRLQDGLPLLLFTDCLRQPILASTLAAALVRLARSSVCGTINIAGRQVLSREQFGRRMLTHFRVPMPHTAEIRAVQAAQVSAAIPLDLRLKLERARTELELELPGVDEVLAEVATGLASTAL